MPNTPAQEFFKSKTFTHIIIGVGIFLSLLVVFRLGIEVGYSRAIFASRFGQQYERNFEGPRRLGMMGGGMMDAHGGFGRVLTVGPQSITIKDEDGTEKSIAVATTTVIRKLNADIGIADLKANDMVAVIGEPDSSGQVDAKLIRVLPDPSFINQAIATSSTTR